MKEKQKEKEKLTPLQKKLKPYRRQIDNLDQKILRLLGQRFGVVRKVAGIKIKNEFPAFLGDRVDEVRNNAVEIGTKYGIDADFIRTLYTMIIYQSCATEDLMKFKYRQEQEGKKPTKKTKAAAQKPKAKKMAKKKKAS